MNARKYRVEVRNTPLDFPAITGLGQTEFVGASEPQLDGDKLLLNIIKQYVLTDMDTNKQYLVLAVQSLYQIPIIEIKNRENVFAIYKDAILSWNEVYQQAQRDMPTLHKTLFPIPSIEEYKREIDRVFNLLNSRN